MKNIDIKEVENLRQPLSDLEDGDAVFISEGSEMKYAVITMNDYEYMEDMLALEKQAEETVNAVNGQIRIVNANNVELSYDEYENFKKKIIEAFDKTFKPKPEKLN